MSVSRVDSRRDTGLDGGQATRALARLSVIRAMRGKAVWVALALVALPIALNSIRVGMGHERAEVWEAAFAAMLLILPILPSILIASSLSDEIEEKTAAYLWSRAVPRWTIVTGKLLGLAPITAAVMVVGTSIGWVIVGGPAEVSVESYLRCAGGLAAGAIAAGTIAAAWATLVPRHAVAASMVWLLFVDLPIGLLPLKLHYLSAAFSATAISGFTATAGEGIASFVGIALLTITIALWRIRRME